MHSGSNNEKSFKEQALELGNEISRVLHGYPSSQNCHDFAKMYLAAKTIAPDLAAAKRDLDGKPVVTDCHGNVVGIIPTGV